MTYKLKVKDVKPMIAWHIHEKDCEVFKSGKDVVLHILKKEWEDDIVERIHKKDLLCVPETIPSCGYYKIMLNPTKIYGVYK